MPSAAPSLASATKFSVRSRIATLIYVNVGEPPAAVELTDLKTRMPPNQPTQIIAAHITAGKVDKTRPLCPYGQVAKYKGTGSTDDAANFSCGR